jgi:ketosteroid isomerase-like protein
VGAAAADARVGPEIGVGARHRRRPGRIGEVTTMLETIATDARAAATIAAIERFNEAFNRHDVDAVMAAMTDDCVFESTSPPPDGPRYVGQEAVRAVWEEFFRSSPRARFETEELFAAGDRCTVRWIYHWLGGDGREGHVRGVDVFRVRDGKVAEKLSYVKG